MAKLFVVSTPIGNLEDISFRALKILKQVALILTEDTRKTRILLNRYQIKTPLGALHQHSSEKKIEWVKRQLDLGKDLALVSEAGTPGISDPGAKLIARLSRKENLKIIPIPGPNAAITALSVSGFSAEKFLFLGFLPKKKGRKKLIQEINLWLDKNHYTIVFYESPHRILDTMQELLSFLGDREVVICRELTKKFEEILRGRLSEVIPKIKKKGEFTVVIG